MVLQRELIYGQFPHPSKYCWPELYYCLSPCEQENPSLSFQLTLFLLWVLKSTLLRCPAPTWAQFLMHTYFALSTYSWRRISGEFILIPSRPKMSSPIEVTFSLLGGDKTKQDECLLVRNIRCKPLAMQKKRPHITNPQKSIFYPEVMARPPMNAES